MVQAHVCEKREGNTGLARTYADKTVSKADAHPVPCHSRVRRNLTAVQLLGSLIN